MHFKLLKQCYQSLKPGGYLIIVETYNEPDTSEKLFSHIVSLNVLINTSQGSIFRTEQVREWLPHIGFQTETWPDLGTDPVLVTVHPRRA